MLLILTYLKILTSLHTVGRTGRGNYKGVAITLYSPDEEHLITLIEDKGYHFENVDVKNNELTIKAHN